MTLNLTTICHVGQRL